MTPSPLLLAVIAAALAAAGQDVRFVPLTRGMIIDRSVTIRPGTYRLDGASNLSRPAITIRGENITVDFAGAVLAGGPDRADPDTFSGVGILIDGGRRVTVKNAAVRGYRIGVLARRSPELRLSHNDFSYNWKPRLLSGVEKESLVDWVSYQQNDKDEWLRQGAARAEATAALPAGDYILEVISDDGVRVWMDGAMILDEWTPHESKVSRVTIRGGGGPRRFKVEYYEAGGFAELRFDVQRR